MLLVHNEVETISYTFFALFILWVVLFFFKQSVGVIKRVRTFYKDVWFMIDFLIVLMSMACIFLFSFRMHLIKIYLNKLESIRRNEFLNYFYLFYLEDFLTVFAAVLVCVATIRLWKFLRFGTMFRVLERTLSISAVPLGSVTFSFTVLLVAFSIVIVILFGNEFEKLDTIVQTVRLLIIMSFKAGELQLSRFVDYKNAVFYFTAYSIVVKIVTFVYIMIIVMSYTEAQLEFSTTTDTYNIKHYVLEQMKYVPRLIRYKFSRLAGGQSKSKVEPKSDKFLYLNSYNVALNRMKMMEDVTKCAIRHINRPLSVTDNDINLMLAICRHTFVKIQY